MVPTADACPFVVRLQLTMEDSAVPNSDRSSTSSPSSSTSAADRYHPVTARYPRQTASAA